MRGVRFKFSWLKNASTCKEEETSFQTHKALLYLVFPPFALLEKDFNLHKGAAEGEAGNAPKGYQIGSLVAYNLPRKKGVGINNFSPFWSIFHHATS